MIKKYISIIVFFWSVTLYCLNLHLNLFDNLNIALFWVSIVLIIGMLIYHILYLENKKFVLFEIVVFYLLLHIVYQVGYYGFHGTDSYSDYNFLKTIVNDHYFVLGEDMITSWPLLHISTSSLFMITKIDLLFLAKFFPLFISTIIVVPIYLLVENVYKNKKVALFSCLLFGTIPQFSFFETLFVREVLGIFVFILFFYMLYIAKQKNDFRLILLTTLLIPTMVLSHHFSSFMLIILLTIYIVCSKFLYRLLYKLFKGNLNLKFNKINIDNFYIVTLGIILTYWLYNATFIFKNFFRSFYEIVGVEETISYAGRIELSGPIVTLRGNIIFYGFFIFAGILCLILLIKIILKRYERVIEDFSFTAFLYFCFFSGFLSLFFIGSVIFPERFLPFGWMLGLIPLTLFIFSLKNKKYKKILFIIVISFLFFNIYNIDPNYYTGNAAIEGGVATVKEYAIAETINISEAYYGYNGIFGAVYDVQGINYSFKSDPIRTSNFFYFAKYAVINEGMYLNYLELTKTKSPDTYSKIRTVLSYEDYYDINKISDLGNIFVLKWGK